jgi:transcription initiation factor IIE alpha subunit
MCWEILVDEDDREHPFFHCHDCDMRVCDEEAYED